MDKSTVQKWAGNGKFSYSIQTRPVSLQGWGLIELLLCSASQSLTSFSRVAWLILDCTHRTRPFLGRAFREHRTNEGVLLFSFLPLFPQIGGAAWRFPTCARPTRGVRDRALREHRESPGHPSPNLSCVERSARLPQAQPRSYLLLRRSAVAASAHWQNVLRTLPCEVGLRARQCVASTAPHALRPLLPSSGK